MTEDQEALAYAQRMSDVMEAFIDSLPEDFTENDMSSFMVMFVSMVFGLDNTASYFHHLGDTVENSAAVRWIKNNGTKLH